MTPNRTESRQTTVDGDVTVRWAREQDREAVRRVAERDSRSAPGGAMLVAELAGAIVAAAPLDGGETVADPFVPTSDVVALLELRATQLAVSVGSRRSRRAAGRLRSLVARRRATRAPVAAPGWAGR